MSAQKANSERSKIRNKTPSKLVSITNAHQFSQVNLLDKLNEVDLFIEGKSAEVDEIVSRSITEFKKIDKEVDLLMMRMHNFTKDVKTICIQEYTNRYQIVMSLLMSSEPTLQLRMAGLVKILYLGNKVTGLILKMILNFPICLPKSQSKVRQVH